MHVGNYFKIHRENIALKDKIKENHFEKKLGGKRKAVSNEYLSQRKLSSEYRRVNQLPVRSWLIFLILTGMGIIIYLLSKDMLESFFST